MFVQNGWDTEVFERVLTPVVERVYIELGVEVTVYKAMPEPVAGKWLGGMGSAIDELISSAELAISDYDNRDDYEGWV